MNKIQTLIFIAASLALSGIARAGEVKIGIVDFQKCIQTSESGKKARGEVEKVLAKRKKEYEDKEAELKKAQEDYMKKKSALSEAAKSEQEGRLQEKFFKLQEMKQKFQAEIQQKEQEMGEPIIRKIREKVAETAKKKGLDIVLEASQQIVIFSEEKLDITADVLKNLN